jgi:hypothetical protein
MKRTLVTLSTVFGMITSVALALAPAAAAETAPNGYPYCANGSASDPDGDGWGWENSQSCVVRTTSGGTTAPNGYPYCANGSAGDPDGDGWGWENNHSCVVPTSGGSSSACPSGMACGSYSVGGLGSRKSQVRAAGGNSLDLAVAMLETDTMTGNYAYGDNKSGDAANFGIFKQNWLMLHSACAQFSGQSAGQYNNGAVLNSNLGQDISCLHQSQSHYGITTWFAGHRNGSSGLGSPNTADIANYRTAVYWIKARIDSDAANLGNDTRYWVSVPAI